MNFTPDELKFLNEITVNESEDPILAEFLETKKKYVTLHEHLEKLQKEFQKLQPEGQALQGSLDTLAKLIINKQRVSRDNHNTDATSSPL